MVNWRACWASGALSPIYVAAVVYSQNYYSAGSVIYAVDDAVNTDANSP